MLFQLQYIRHLFKYISDIVKFIGLVTVVLIYEYTEHWYLTTPSPIKWKTVFLCRCDSWTKSLVTNFSLLIWWYYSIPVGNSADNQNEVQKSKMTRIFVGTVATNQYPVSLRFFCCSVLLFLYCKATPGNIKI